MVTEFEIPAPQSRPYAIVSGPEGTLGFTEFSGNKIRRINALGAAAEIPVTAGSAPLGFRPFGAYQLRAAATGSKSSKGVHDGQPERRSGSAGELRPDGRTGERLACGLDRSPDPALVLRSRGGRLLLAFARRLLPPRRHPLRRFATRR